MSNDEAKDFVLQYLLKQQRKYPERSIGYPKAMITHDHDFNLGDEARSAVAMAVDFLEDEGFIKSQSQQHVKYYRLSSKGQTRVMGPSIYSRSNISSGGAHVTNNGGLVFMGDNYGTVAVELRTEVSNALNDFVEMVSMLKDVEDNIKADLIQSATTIDAQVKTQKPDKTIITRAWEAMQVATTLASAGQYLIQLEPHISHLLQSIH